MKPPTLSSNGERCEKCGIRNTALFADLRESDFELIHQPIDDLEFPVGEVLYAAGERAGHLYTLRSGLIKLEQYLPDGTQRIVRLLQPGDVAGLEATVADDYEHTAVALEPISVCRIPKSVVRTLNEQTPRLHGRLMERWRKALREADRWLTELSTGTARERVARLLLAQCDCTEGDQFHLLGREDIGAMLGITTETASRVVAEFKRAGLIKVSSGRAQLLDHERLEKIAGHAA
ncbi:MAG: Crp/Fnr family transcriptional regulator [Gammaproteobacteria bacterium]